MSSRSFWRKTSADVTPSTARRGLHSGTIEPCFQEALRRNPICFAPQNASK